MTASHENQEYITTLFDTTQTLDNTNGKITADNALCLSKNKINVVIMTEVT